MCNNTYGILVSFSTLIVSVGAFSTTVQHLEMELIVVLGVLLLMV